MNSQNSSIFFTNQSEISMAYCKIIWNTDGQPIDIILLNSNPEFAKNHSIPLNNSILSTFNQLFDDTVDILNFFASISLTRQQNAFHFNLSENPITITGYPLFDGDILIQLGPFVASSGFYDDLTGLYNKSFFEEEIGRLNTIRQLPLSIIIGDINGLERINELFGRLEGDRILKELAIILKKSCRSDDIVSRWGGDEFKIFLPKTDNYAVQVIINRIYRACKKLRLEGPQLNISLGYATKTSIHEDMTSLFQQAEASMSKHKLLDKNSIHSPHVHTLIKPTHDSDLDREEHAKKILSYVMTIGQALNLSEDYMNDLKLLTVLHNIGTLGSTEKILAQPKKLDDSEWEIVKKHPEMGFKIAKDAPHLSHIADSILYHHERWDGSGYPRGISGNSIPLCSRILAVSDAYDAMTSPRVYRDELPVANALEELQKNAGTQFDPTIVKLFIETYPFEV